MFPDDNRIIAYELADPDGMSLSRGGLTRDWMDTSPERFPYRCLPLTIANQHGWMIACPADVTAVWDGTPGTSSVRLDFGDVPAAPAAETFGGSVLAAPFAHRAPPDRRVNSQFGNGIVTFSIPYLFRTPRGVNLWVKGPSNYLKDGVQPLEGIVEADWLAATFTMNWKLTRPLHPVRFTRGEPICMVVPLVRGLAEALEPVAAPLETNPELAKDYHAWADARNRFIADLVLQKTPNELPPWQGDYTYGVTPRGESAEEHQTRLHLKDFRRES